jgi:hypothetical protein
VSEKDDNFSIAIILLKMWTLIKSLQQKNQSSRIKVKKYFWFKKKKSKLKIESTKNFRKRQTIENFKVRMFELS